MFRMVQPRWAVAFVAALLIIPGLSADGPEKPAAPKAEELAAKVKELQGVIDALGKDFAAKVEWAALAAEAKAAEATARHHALLVDVALMKQRNARLEKRLRELERLGGGDDKKAEEFALKDLEKLKADYAKLLKEMEGRGKRYEAEQAAREKEAAAAKAAHTAVVKVLTAELVRARTEAEALKADAAARDEKILKLTKEIAQLRDRAVACEAEARANAEALAKLLVERAKPGLKPISDKNYSNPPPRMVKGKILKVDEKDRTLVIVSVGTDLGVKADHTLEVYRLKPQAPKYLGRIRIVEASPREAVGRLMRGEKEAAKAPLQVGDEVASKIE